MSADDLIRFDRALTRGTLLPPTSVRVMCTARVAVPDSGLVAPREHYGYGWYISRRGGREWVWHSGNFAGFAAMLVTVPSEDLAAAVLSNLSDTDAIRVGVEVIEQMLGRSID